MTYTSKFSGEQIDGAIRSSVYDLVVPPNFFAVTGTEFKINLSNATNAINANPNWVLSGVGSHMAGQLLDSTPDTSDNGATITIEQQSLEGVSLVSASSSYVVTAATQSGSLSVLVIGDSTIAGGNIVDAIQTSATTDGVLSLTWVGTQGTTNMHEGYSGKTIDWFYTDMTSPFYDASGFDTGFGNYCDTNGVPDAVIIKLGINDFYGASTDTAVNTAASAALPKLQGMIAGITTKNPDAQIAVDLIGGPSSQDNVGSNYGLLSAWRIRRNFQIWNELLVATNLGDNTTIIHGNLSISLDNYANALHPDATGYGEIADTYYAWLKYLASQSAGIAYLGWHDSIYNDAALPTTQDYGFLSGDILTSTIIGTAFNGVAARYGASVKGQYSITVCYKVGADPDSNVAIGLKLWNGTAPVDYDLPTDSADVLESYIGYLNYDNRSVGTTDYVTLSMTIDLSLAPDFTSLSVCASGKATTSGSGLEAIMLDLSQTSVQLL